MPAERAGAAHAEDYTLRLAGRIGLSPFETWVETIDDRIALVVQRYDRVMDGDRIERIHQEDFAQASNLSWLGDDKFEQNNPAASFRALAQLLDQQRAVFSQTPSDREQLLRYTVFNVAVGNTDAHAKNFSILRYQDGTSKLAPLYDAAPLA